MQKLQGVTLTLTHRWVILIKAFIRKFSDCEESEALKASLCEDEHHGVKKSIQGFVKILIFLHKIWTSVNVKRLWCAASEDSLRKGNADTDIKKLPFSYS